MVPDPQCGITLTRWGSGTFYQSIFSRTKSDFHAQIQKNERRESNNSGLTE